MKLTDIGIRTKSTRDIMREDMRRSGDDRADAHNLDRALDYIDVLETVVDDLTDAGKKLGIEIAELRTISKPVRVSREPSAHEAACIACPMPTCPYRSAMALTKTVRNDVARKAAREQARVRAVIEVTECETCDGTRRLPPDFSGSGGLPCPDCPDGRETGKP